MINNNLYYFCAKGKNPHMGKIRACCDKKQCPYLRTRHRKNKRQKRSNKNKVSSDEGDIFSFPQVFFGVVVQM